MSYSKNYNCKFMQVNSWRHKLFHFHLPFCIWKVWKGRDKITKIWIWRERKKLLRWNKKTFLIVRKGLSFGEKIKNWQKIADTSFKVKIIKRKQINGRETTSKCLCWLQFLLKEIYCGVYGNTDSIYNFHYLGQNPESWITVCVASFI